jgi:FixJ family two-component response regulator
MPSVFVVDDNLAVRESLSLLLEVKGFTVESFPSAEVFLETIKTGRPDCCAIVDVNMTGMDGFQLQEELSRRGILLPIIFLTGYGNIPMSVRAIKAGAVDFLTKPVSAGELDKTVRAALEEGKKLFADMQQSQTAEQRAHSLTQRETEIWALLAEGLSNKEIARRLDISHRTVELHRARIMKKTESANLLELAELYNAAHARPAR